jgi:dolichol-phosphate mannosyltransferase
MRAGAERVLITGGGGFLGAGLARRLLDAGHEVHLLLRPGGSRRRLADLEGRFHAHDADLLDGPAVKRAVAACRPEVVFHLAAEGVHGGRGLDESVRGNVLATAHLLEALEGHDYRALVHAGSGAEYGPREGAIPEDAPLCPATDYAAAKAAASLLVLAQARRGRPAVVVRIFGAYGPGEAPARLVPYVMGCCRDGVAARVSAGEQRRDFVFADDVHELLLAAARDPSAGPVLHAGTGQAHRVRDVVEAVRRLCGPGPGPVYGAHQRPGEPALYLADVARTTDRTGWRPRHDLEAGLHRTWEWFRAAPAAGAVSFFGAREFRPPGAAEMAAPPNPDTTAASSATEGRMAAEEPWLSLVVPVLDEEEVLGETYAVLTRILAGLGRPYEVIVVDNGSTDRTPGIAAGLCRHDPRWRYLRLSRNFGYQNSITAGMLAAAGEGILVIDADLQDPPELIPQFVARWQEGYDVVYGVRARRVGEPLWRTVPTMLAMRLITWMSDEFKLPAHSGDFRLISRRVRDAFAQLPENNRYVRGLIHWLGFRQVGVPYTRLGRTRGSSKVNWPHLIGFTCNAIINFSIKPVRFFALLGLGVLGLAAVLAALWLPGMAGGMTGVHLLLLLNLGVLGCGVGALGEYLAKVHLDGKRRPLFLVDYTINLDPERVRHPAGLAPARTAPPGRPAFEASVAEVA